MTRLAQALVLIATAAFVVIGLRHFWRLAWH